MFIKIWEHICLTCISLFFATALAFPLGLYLTRSRFKWLPKCMIQMAGLIQTIPGLAMIAFIVVLLSYVPFQATGFIPGILTLTIYALFPILTNTYTAIRGVDLTLLEVAKGLGMTPGQILIYVEIPMAIPVIMTGIRIAAVWIIGMATLTSLVGAGGLGDLILQGLRSMQFKLVFAGTLPAAILAILFDWGITKVERWLKN